MVLDFFYFVDLLEAELLPNNNCCVFFFIQILEETSITYTDFPGINRLPFNIRSCFQGFLSGLFHCAVAC